MIPVKESARVINILWVMMRHGLDDFVLSSQKFRFIRFMRLLSPFIGRIVQNKHHVACVYVARSKSLALSM